MNRLKELREQSGLSLPELAQRSDLDQHLLSQLEEGQTQPDPETTGKLVDALNAALFSQDIKVTAQDILAGQAQPVESKPAVKASTSSGTGKGPAVPTITSYAMPSRLFNMGHDTTQATPTKSTAPTPASQQPVTAPGVITSPPGYLSYQTKKEVEQTKLIRRVVSIVIGLAITGWVIWRLFQQARQDPGNPFPQSSSDVIILPASE